VFLGSVQLGDMPAPRNMRAKWQDLGGDGRNRAGQELKPGHGHLDLKERISGGLVGGMARAVPRRQDVVRAIAARRGVTAKHAEGTTRWVGLVLAKRRVAPVIDVLPRPDGKRGAIADWRAWHVLAHDVMCQWGNGYPVHDQDEDCKSMRLMRHVASLGKGGPKCHYSHYRCIFFAKRHNRIGKRKPEWICDS
jgi:hypothetical protein